jgi:proteasome lid subunit RPN8/RPN11
VGHEHTNPLAPEPADKRRLVLGAMADCIRFEAQAAFPEECCGILLGVIHEDTRLVMQMTRCRNVRAGDGRRYAIDPKDLVAAQRDARARGFEILGFYHSHPGQPAEPSRTDLAEAYWEGCSYVIVSVSDQKAGEMRSFVLRDGRFTEEQVV